MRTIVTVHGVTNHGKNRVKEHGELWYVIDDHPLTPKSSNTLLQSVKTGYKRWLNKDFSVV